MARQNFCSNCVPRLELDQRAREARLRLLKVEHLLVRLPPRRFQLVRLFVGRLFSEPKGNQDQASPNSSSGSSIPGIDSAGFDVCHALARGAA